MDGDWKVFKCVGGYTLWRNSNGRWQWTNDHNGKPDKPAGEGFRFRWEADHEQAFCVASKR
jgi:hypothetical protein